MWSIDQLQEELNARLTTVNHLKDLEETRIHYLGKKGIVAQIYSSLATVSAVDKPAIGKLANDFKKIATDLIDAKQKMLGSMTASSKPKDYLDISLPGVAQPMGHHHILSQTIDEICSILERLGFEYKEGPEIETEFHNFTALNIPVDHPSRDAFDTFYLDVDDPERQGRNLLLRSHTSPGQIRVMQQQKPPLAVVIPGKVYRPDAVDASHSFMFHQIEGLLVDRDVKFSHLKGLLLSFCQRFFSKDIRLRLRPHFFPFTEPSAEVDVSCYICDARGCSVCGRKGWLEIMGCGMVHPNVFAAVGYPKGKFSGLAFGMGVERMAMLKHGIHDIRIFFENDIRFLKQF